MIQLPVNTLFGRWYLYSDDGVAPRLDRDQECLITHDRGIELSLKPIDPMLGVANELRTMAKKTGPPLIGRGKTDLRLDHYITVLTSLFTVATMVVIGELDMHGVPQQPAGTDLFQALAIGVVWGQGIYLVLLWFCALHAIDQDGRCLIESTKYPEKDCWRPGIIKHLDKKERISRAWARNNGVRVTTTLVMATCMWSLYWYDENHPADKKSLKSQRTWKIYYVVCATVMYLVVILMAAYAAHVNMKFFNGIRRELSRIPRMNFSKRKEFIETIKVSGLQVH
jgi:hypothetical protein